MECAAKGSGTPCTPGAPTRRCGTCGAVAYCSMSHQMSHWNYHKGECARFAEQMRRADVLNDFSLTFSVETSLQVSKCSFLSSKGLHHIGLWESECSCWTSMTSSDPSCIVNDWNLPNSLCPCTEPRYPKPVSLQSWKDYYDWRCIPLHSPVALLLHWPLTLYYCIQLSATRSQISEIGQELHIHYLGPDKEIFQLAVFGELQALFPGVKMHIELVGPAVPQLWDGETISLCSYPRCSEDDCPCKSSQTCSNGRESGLSLKLHKGFYHDRYRDILKESFPQLIIAPNAGVAAYSSWLPTIRVIKEMGVPAIFTDFCEEAAHLAACCINSITGDSLRLPIQVNPFRQPMAVEDSALYLPCYSNCFIFGI